MPPTDITAAFNFVRFPATGQRFLARAATDDPTAEPKEYSLEELQEWAASTDGPKEFCFACTTKVDRHWVLIDNQSTVDLFSNTDLLEDVHEGEHEVTVTSDGGVTTTKLVGHLPGYGWVYVNPDGIANILSFYRVWKRFPIGFSSEGFHVKGTRGTMTFRPSSKGLFFYDTLKRDEIDADGESRAPDTAFTQLSVPTIADNIRRHHISAAAQRRADHARRVQAIMAFPSTATYRDVVRGNDVCNIDVSVADIDNADRVYGPVVAALRGKTVRRKPHSTINTYVEIPRALKDPWKNVDLTADIFFIDGRAFVICKSRGIGYIMTKAIKTRSKAKLVRSLKIMARIHAPWVRHPQCHS